MRKLQRNRTQMRWTTCQMIANQWSLRWSHRIAHTLIAMTRNLSSFHFDFFHLISLLNVFFVVIFSFEISCGLFATKSSIRTLALRNGDHFNGIHQTKKENIEFHDARSKKCSNQLIVTYFIRFFSQYVNLSQ